MNMMKGNLQDPPLKSLKLNYKVWKMLPGAEQSALSGWVGYVTAAQCTMSVGAGPPAGKDLTRGQFHKKSVSRELSQVKLSSR